MMFSGKNAKRLQTLSSHTSDVTSVEFFGSSVLVTGSSDKSVRVWKWTVGKGFVEESFSPLIGHKYGVTCVRVSPQGAVLASSSIDGRIILWNLTNGEQITVLLQDQGEAIRSCAFSPNGKYLVSCDDTGALNFFNNEWNLIMTVKHHEETVQTIAFSSDSKVLVSGCLLGNLRMYQLDLDDQQPSIDCSVDNAHDLGVLCTAFCKQVFTDGYDGQSKIYTIATSGMDHYIKLWRIFCKEVSEDETKRSKGSRLLPTSNQEHLCFKSTIYATRRMNTENILQIAAHGSSVTCLRFNNAGTLLVSGSFDQTIKIWDMKGNVLRTLMEHTRYVNCIALNSDCVIMASGSNDRKTIVWDLHGTLNLDAPLTDMKTALFRLATSQDNVPIEYICPITHEIMQNPVLAEDGFSYEEDAINEWFGTGKKTSPMTNTDLKTTDCAPNFILKQKIENYLKSFDD